MHRALLPALLCLAACGRPARGPWATDPDAPLALGETSVLWLLLCTVRADHTGPWGYDLPTTPTLDALADGGVRIRRTVPAGAWTRPSVASQMTSLTPRTLGIDPPREHAFTDVYRVVPEAQTVAEWFDAAGYGTVGVSANPNEHTFLGYGQGYDAFVDSDAMTGHRPDPEDKVPSRQVSDELLGMIDALPEGEPFFGHALYVGAHAPLGWWSYVPHPSLGFLGTPAQNYDRSIRRDDDELARLLDALEARGRTRNLLVVITSDHGEGVLRGEREGHGVPTYNAQSWILWMMAHPALPGGTEGQHPASGVDVLPTLADLLGGPAPDLTDGRSVRASWEAPEAFTPRPFEVTETAFDGTLRASVVDDTWRLVATGEPPTRRELYRWREDWLEQDDLAATEPEVVARMEGWLAAWRAEHPQRFDARLDQDLDDDARKQLEILGYVD
ncbi:MAG: sulfatase-like hydrolase/transferase [Alphaproteobacteria bacterium]|nr:sulfatase-like hydrolase/transferase [Alphaproteobacteria bacterium]